MSQNNRNPAPRAAGRASETFILAAERAEHSQALAKLQVRSLLDYSAATALCIVALDPGSSS